MFEGFTLRRLDVGDAELRVRYGGSGPAVLLLQGVAQRPAIDCGHYLAEEASAELASRLIEFFAPTSVTAVSPHWPR